MPQSNSSSEAFGWKVYRLAPQEIKDAFLKELNLDFQLPLVTWEGQVNLLDGAPDDVIIKYLPQLYWKAQVEMYEKHLSVSSHEKAIPFLDVLAKRYLKIAIPKPVRKRWHYK